MTTPAYPFATLETGEVSFQNGRLLSLPSEYLKPKKKIEIASFYRAILIQHHDDLYGGTDPLGFDYLVFDTFCYVGLLIGLSNSALANANRKKFPSHRFDRQYIFQRVQEDKKLLTFEEFIPIEIVTQNFHEMRGINANISASVDQIIDASDESDWEIKFDKADENIKKIYVGSRLTKFMLDNIRFYMPDYIESLKPNTDRSFFIHKAVNKIVKIYSNNFKKRKLKIELQGICFKQLKGDKELFEIILMLLVENAIKYSRDTDTLPPFVKIHQDSQIVTISIHSYGSLIPNEDIPRLFIRGFRSSVHKSRREGTGMGLHNASKLIMLLGGSIRYSKQEAAPDDKVTGWNIFTLTCCNTF